MLLPGRFLQKLQLGTISQDEVNAGSRPEPNLLGQIPFQHFL